MNEPSRSRRLARQLAFEALYSVQVGHCPVEEAVTDVLARQPLVTDSEDFMRGLVNGVSKAVREIDGDIGHYLARGWSVDRLAVTDLVVLRIAVYEIHHLPGMPPKVTITQAVELAKTFGGADSGRFVNGVLASVLAGSSKADWDPSMEEKQPVDEEASAPSEDRTDVEGPELARFKVGPWVVKSDD